VGFEHVGTFGINYVISSEMSSAEFCALLVFCAPTVLASCLAYFLGL